MRGFLGLLGLTLALSLAACGKPAPKAADVAAGKLFLIRNSAAPGVITTPSGLQYRVIHSGPADGLRPKLADEVKVNYEGKLTDGTVFDASAKHGGPATFPLNHVIPCWTEGVQKMKVGGKAQLVCPADIAYGDSGRPGIPGGATLVFEIELLEIGGAPAAK